MRILFWLCTALIMYAYVGYAVWLRVLVSWRRLAITRAFNQPTVSIIIAARNEEVNLPAKLQNLRELDYQKDQLQVIVASDGSTDQTAAILQENRDFLIPVILQQSSGKACALNEAVKHATGDILLFLDARQSVDTDAVSMLTSPFADPTVGAVSGELLLDDSSDGASSNGLGVYWKLEKVVRKLESETGSVVGVTGAIYAIRRELYPQLLAGTILDDVFIPMHVARMGKRVIFEPTAIARDRFFSERGKEFSRKVRTLTGNYQLIKLAPWILSPNNPLLFRFVSHKLLRLVVPLLLVVIMLASGWISLPFYRDVFWLQVAFYLAALLGFLFPPVNKLKAISIARTFVMLNAAATVAFYYFLVRRKRVWI